MSNTHIYIDGNPFYINGNTISWLNFTLYHFGTGYNISAGSTTYKYVYWRIGENFLRSTDGWIGGGDSDIILVYRIQSGMYYRLYNKRTSFSLDFLDGATLRNSTIKYSKMADVPNSMIYVFNSGRQIYSTTFSSAGIYDIFNISSNVIGVEYPYMRIIIPYLITFSSGVNEIMQFLWRLKFNDLASGSTHHYSLGHIQRFTAPSSFDMAYVAHINDSGNYGVIIGCATLTNNSIRRWGGIMDIIIDGHTFHTSYREDTNLGVYSNSHYTGYLANDTLKFMETAKIGSTMRGWAHSSIPITIRLDVLSKSGTNVATLKYSYCAYIGYNVTFTMG